MTMALHCSVVFTLFLAIGNQCVIAKGSAPPPHIVMIVADDLGWNDVSFHGSQQIPTPNIDKLAREGVILNNYYTMPLCTPTRAAIMTGRYGIHTGMQKSVIRGPSPWGLGLDEKLLPEYLKSMNYKTHAVGKWHLGFFAKEYTPTYRGFETFYGYYQGKGDYWDHSTKWLYWGLDLHDDAAGRESRPVHTQWGNYSTEMFTAEAEARVRDHDLSDEGSPLFLYLANQAVHSANWAADPVQAPKRWINKFKHIKNPMRRKFAAVTSYMDFSVGRVVQALERRGMLDNTILIFTTDNGGPAGGFDFNWANNWPLRGVKATLWEGGVRGSALVYSKLLSNASVGRVSTDLMHCTDWLPTLLSAAGADASHLKELDGVDMWPMIADGEPSARTEVLLNMGGEGDILDGNALRMGDWKLIQQGVLWSGWYPATDDNSTGASNLVASMDLSNGDVDGNSAWVTADDYLKGAKVTEEDRIKEAEVKCGPHPEHPALCNRYAGPCLFNIAEDPCEHRDVRDEHPEVYQRMKERLEVYRKGAVPPRNVAEFDPMSDPKLHNGVWEPWVKL